jgi:hypothetical protein
LYRRLGRMLVYLGVENATSSLIHHILCLYKV